ncbi:MAG: ATP-dependent DNA helicase [Betaproteobacteria bacterium]|nr:ATP-dependent DNA helicase [Betaproteobacteria bacterium]
MMLLQQVRAAFAEAGTLSQMVDEFRPRQGQSDMAAAIASTLESGGVLVVEAGTGIGKTFSYLVPVLLSGQRTLVSTATKTLQDQLFSRDLPRLIRALSLPIRVAVLKGRASYLCLYRLKLARERVDLTDQPAMTGVARIELWAQATQTGDLAEIPGLDERSSLIPMVTSTRENCLGSPCPSWRDCYVNQARREALAADIVVVNHHLFFADLAVRESGVAELLPTVNTVIFDEAHQLNETGVLFLGHQLGTAQLLDFSRDLLGLGVLHARGWCDWQQLASDLEHATLDWRMLVGRQPTATKLRWLSQAPETLHEASWQEAMAAVANACGKASLALSQVSEAEPELSRLATRALAFTERLAGFMAPCEAGAVRWLEVGPHLKLIETPLDIADTVKARLLRERDDPPDRRAWIFTSATLGDDPGLTWFTEPCGLANATILKIQSPFDYAAQAGLYIPAHLPKPLARDHSEQVARFVAQHAPILGGRTLVLTTSLRALQVISGLLQQQFSSTQGLHILVQGQGPKRELIQRFREGNEAGGPGCVLLASASFWEGVDIPGAALQMVVIDKLPFPSPGDPLVEARAQRLEAAGRKVFKDYYLPEAAVALKQGAGRLIRHETDRGVLVVCDTRLSSMGYGRRLLASLPPMRRLAAPEDFLAFLAGLTKPSTKDQSWP